MITPEEEEYNSARDRQGAIRSKTASANHIGTQENALRRATTSTREERSPPGDVRPQKGVLGTSEESSQTDTGVFPAVTRRKGRFVRLRTRRVIYRIKPVRLQWVPPEIIQKGPAKLPSQVA